MGPVKMNTVTFTIKTFLERTNKLTWLYGTLACFILIMVVDKRTVLIDHFQYEGSGTMGGNSSPQIDKSDSRRIHRNQNKYTFQTVIPVELQVDSLDVSPYDSEIYNKKHENLVPWQQSYGQSYHDKENKRGHPILTKTRWVKSVDCGAIISGNRLEIRKAMTLENDYLKVLSPHYYLARTQDCGRFLESRQYIKDYLSEEERHFSIAYSIVIYKSVYQFERLLRTIYRPQNYYCIHADSKMSDTDNDAVASITKCFDNVFIASQSFDVKWGNFSVLAADLICMKDLLRYKKWKYFINLTGQEFPLKTNEELVKILKSYKAANDVNINLENDIDWADRWKNNSAPPNSIIPYKGSVHIAVNRDFVHFTIRNGTAIELLKWVKETQIPDETFFTTLNHNPQLGIRGSYNGNLRNKDKFTKADMARTKNWKRTRHFPCYGMKSHGICIISVADLPFLIKRPEMFVNKLFWDYQHYALDCLEEYIHNKTVDGYYGTTQFNATLYSNLYFVRHSVQ